MIGHRNCSQLVVFFFGAIAVTMSVASLGFAQDAPAAAAPAASAPAVPANGKAYIAVGTAKAKKTVLAFPEIRASGEKAQSLAKTIQETVNNDLLYMDLFRFIPQSSFTENKATAGLALGTFKLSDWTSIGAEFVIKAGLTLEGQNIALESYLHDTAGAKQVLGKRFVATQSEARTVGHTFANAIVEVLTGQPGIFLTKITMVCDRTGQKEVYVMNFDGSDVKQVTRHRSTAIAPNWSPDGSKIAYTVVMKNRKNIKNPDLYEFDFNTSSIHLLSNRKGMNSGAAYSPTGRKIALTMSFGGNQDIYVLDPGSQQVTRLSKTFGLDVDPTWSPDGKEIAFVSNRSGKAMIYKMKADGSDPQRLTFAGDYNASPSWSPTNNKIAFAGWIDGRFDIFTMNPDGTNIERLTKGSGNNEDPAMSPDGGFVAFSSNRAGARNIYVMNIDGTFSRRLTVGLGNCSSPKWSLPPRQ